MGKNMLFFFAGWFSVAIGFEIAPVYGNIAGVVSFILLTLIFSKRESRRTWRALDGYNEPPENVVPPSKNPSPAPPSVKNRRQ